VDALFVFSYAKGHPPFKVKRRMIDSKKAPSIGFFGMDDRVWQ
jgi:hypothetical protein